jgi:NAD(P)H-hydrate epimerase
MAFLTGEEIKTIQRYRIESAQHWADEWGHVVVLKGAFTIVAAPDGRTALLPFANPSLARAGTGDVLAGMIAGFRAQGVGAFEAAVLGAFLHAQAGEIAEQRIGYSGSVIAGDLIRFLPHAFQELQEG